MKPLNIKDRKLIYELDLDSRQTASQIGRKIGLSKQGVTLKINNLVKKGIIKRFVTVLNTKLLGRLSFRMYFKLIDANPIKERAFRDYLVNNRDVPWVVGCEGIWDYMIVVFPNDFESFENFSVKLNNRFGEYIEKKDIALVTVAYHFRSGYIFGKKSNISPLIYAGQPSKLIKFDEKDLKILSFLAKNARMPIADISRKVKLNAKTVANRINRLKELNIIEGFTISVDYNKIGFERYKIFIRIKNFSEKKENDFIDYSQKHPYVLYYSKSIGPSDVELELIVKDSLHLKEVLGEIREKFGGIIKSYEVMKIYSEFKLDFYPFE